MKRSGKSRGGIFAAALAVATVLGFAGRASADTKPKFVYVTNTEHTLSGASVKTFQLTGTATCISHSCASPLAISGTFSVTSYQTQAWIMSGTIFVTDTGDLNASPVGLSYGFNPVADPAAPTALFGANTPTTSKMELFFSPVALPPTYSGGMLCTVASASGCARISNLIIAAADMSPGLLASTGGISVTAQIDSATITMTNSSQGSDSISGYAVDSATGALTLLPGSPFPAGLLPTSLVVDPSNKFVYVANQGSNTISAYAVNSTTGALTPVTGSPFPAGTTPHSIAIDPSGKFIYVANEGSNNVSAYTIDTETGALTAMGGSPYTTGSTPVWVTIDPVGHFVYVLDSDLIAPSWATSAYTYDTTTGALTPIPSAKFDTMWGPIAATFDPSGKFLFEIGHFAYQWGAFALAVNNTTGAVTRQNVGTGGGEVLPSALALHPSGKFLDVTDPSFGLGFIVAYSVDSTGGLTVIPGSAQDNYGIWNVPAGQYATGATPESIIVDPSGKFAYVGNEGTDNISAFAINAVTGVLTPVVGTPFAAGAAPTSVGIVSSPASVVFDKFKTDVNIDVDRKTSFRVDGFFTLGAGSDGIYPLSEPVALQVGSYSVTLPAGLFHERGRHEFVYEGHINDVDLRITIEHADRDDHDDKDRRNRRDHDEKKTPEPANEYHITAEGRGRILQGIKNPVAVGLTIGDDEGSVTVKADIDK